MIVQIVIFRVVIPSGLANKYNFLEEHDAPIFRIEAENGDGILLRNVVSTYGVTTLKTTIGVIIYIWKSLVFYLANC
jgi:hypothetical protein